MQRSDDRDMREAGGGAGVRVYEVPLNAMAAAAAIRACSNEAVRRRIAPFIPAKGETVVIATGFRERADNSRIRTR